MTVPKESDYEESEEESKPPQNKRYKVTYEKEEADEDDDGDDGDLDDEDNSDSDDDEDESKKRNEKGLGAKANTKNNGELIQTNKEKKTNAIHMYLESASVQNEKKRKTIKGTVDKTAVLHVIWPYVKFPTKTMLEDHAREVNNMKLVGDEPKLEVNFFETFMTKINYIEPKYTMMHKVAYWSRNLDAIMNEIKRLRNEKNNTVKDKIKMGKFNILFVNSD